jgi:hypothetical protein
MKESWQVWRWDEQWIPHTTWFLMALATRYDEKPESIEPPVSIPGKAAVASRAMVVNLQGRVLAVSAAGAKDGVTVTVLGLDGAKVASGTLNAGRATLGLESVKSGAYLVKVEGFGARKVLVR